jgi:hypothetical protein
MPYYQRLIQWLIMAPHRADTAGEIDLTVAEAVYGQIPPAAAPWIGSRCSTRRPRPS